MQVIVGIGAKPAVSPFEAVGVNSQVGGIEVCFDAKFNESY
jgi:monodehydroascorbate reductase (NADH)